MERFKKKRKSSSVMPADIGMHSRKESPQLQRSLTTSSISFRANRNKKLIRMQRHIHYSQLPSAYTLLSLHPPCHISTYHTYPYPPPLTCLGLGALGSLLGQERTTAAVQARHPRGRHRDRLPPPPTPLGRGAPRRGRTGRLRGTRLAV